MFSTLPMAKLDAFMQKQGLGQFSFETFKVAYDTDPRIKNLIKNFDKDKIEFKQDETEDLPTATEPAADNTVSNMAKSATDLGDNL
jgi:hypothetical protein